MLIFIQVDKIFSLVPSDQKIGLILTRLLTFQFYCRFQIVTDNLFKTQHSKYELQPSTISSIDTACLQSFVQLTVCMS